jgi:CPA2 family monovalent cation:H+ antiporter-2
MVVIAFKLGLSIVLLVGFMALLLRIKSYRFPFSRAVLKSNEFATLAVCGVCFGSATVSALLGLSPALGAFLGGIGVGHSTLRRPAVSVAGPIYSILLFAFFFSVGLLIDVRFVWRELWLVGIALFIVAGGKTLLNYAALRLFRQPHATAFLVALFLAPIGEFSFVLAESASESGVMTPEGRDFAIDIVALSLLVSPLWYLAARHAHRIALGPLTSGVTTAPAAPDAPAPPGPDG